MSFSPQFPFIWTALAHHHLLPCCALREYHTLSAVTHTRIVRTQHYACFSFLRVCCFHSCMFPNAKEDLDPAFQCIHFIEAKFSVIKGCCSLLYLQKKWNFTPQRNFWMHSIAVQRWTKGALNSKLHHKGGLFSTSVKTSVSKL